MHHRLSTRNKLLLAFGLNAFFYPVLIYVNLDGSNRDWQVIFGPFFSILASEFVLGGLVIFGWLFLAERIHEQFERWFGEEIISKGGILPNAMAILAFAAANLLVSIGAIRFIYWLQNLTLQRPDHAIVSQSAYHQMSMRFTYANYVIMALFVYYLLTNRRIRQRIRAVARRAEQAQKEQVEAQYSLLRSRVNPHFLFNSLSTLSSLVQIDGDLSEQFIDRLSKAYRYMLEYRDRQTVLLKDELDFLHAYAFLLSTRFGGKLRIETDVPDALARDTEVVPLILQVLVARALRTNRMSAQNPLVVSIRAEGDELTVRNNRQPRLEHDHSIDDCDWGVFENCYRMLDAGQQRLRETVDDHFWTVHLPLLRKEEAAGASS